MSEKMGKDDDESQMGGEKKVNVKSTRLYHDDRRGRARGRNFTRQIREQRQNLRLVGKLTIQRRLETA